MADGTNVGRIVEIKGVVLDAVFDGQLPAIYNALEIPIPGVDRILVAEVQQHLGDDRVRAVAMDATDGLARGTEVIDTGAPISRARRRASRWAASSTCSARRSTRATTTPTDAERWPIHREPPAFDDLVADGRDLRDRHQGHRPARPVRPKAARSASSAAPASARRC